VIERALIDYYRCPEDAVSMALTGELSADSGYFRFGPNVCFGQTASGRRSPTPGDALYDAAAAAEGVGGRLHLPFDPSQIVDNLRLERYVAQSGSTDVRPQTSWQKRLYYSFRAFMPDALRRALQRTYFRGFNVRRFPGWPVDTTVDELLGRLLSLSLRARGITQLPFVWFWPDGASSCAVVTHDVETSIGRDRSSWLMDLDEAHGIKSSFQIVPEDRYTVTLALLDEIRNRGFEINIHDVNHDGHLFSDLQEFRVRAKRINQYAAEFGARGFRSGQLYRHPDWYDALDIGYDMSIPNTAHLEIQRGGCCTVMPYFIGNIVELPLTTTQDYSLFHILKDFSNDVWEQQISSISRIHGLISFITHPDYLGGADAQCAYRVLLERLARLRDREGCWVALPGEVEAWWRLRSGLTLRRDGDRWRIEGAGKERARVAYAQVQGDALVYRIEAPLPAATMATQ
jgi:hypothetical protein